jgi:hypothetical protein
MAPENPPPVDPNALPLKGVVAELRDEGESIRVTFTRLAGIYQLPKHTEGFDALMERLQSSRDALSEIHLRYRYPEKAIVSIGE